jgi:hypothetical protein
MDTLESHNEELDESDVERQVEEFRKKLESLESTEVKKKMKPNISNDWIKELRQRLNSISTTDNSIERNRGENSSRLKSIDKPRAMASI